MADKPPRYTRRTDPIFEVFDSDAAFRTTPTEEEMQQVWDLIGNLMERYLRLRPIWQVAAGAFIEGFETGMLKRMYWYGEGGFPKDSLPDQDDPPPSKKPMTIGTSPIVDHPRIPKDLLTEEEAADYLGIRVHTLQQWRGSGSYRKNEKIPYLKVGRAVRYRKADLVAWTVSRVGQAERDKEEKIKEQRTKQEEYLRRQYGNVVADRILGQEKYKGTPMPEPPPPPPPDAPPPPPPRPPPPRSRKEEREEFWKEQDNSAAKARKAKKR